VELTADRRTRLEAAYDLEMEQNRLTDDFAERMEGRGTLSPCSDCWLVVEWLLPCLTGFAPYEGDVQNDDEGDEGEEDPEDGDKDEGEKDPEEEEEEPLPNSQRQRLEAIKKSMRYAQPLTELVGGWAYSADLLIDDQIVAETLTQLHDLNVNLEAADCMDLFSRLERYCAYPKRPILLARYYQGVHTPVQS
jgi:hypothetical protein